MIVLRLVTSDRLQKLLVAHLRSRLYIDWRAHEAASHTLRWPTGFFEFSLQLPENPLRCRASQCFWDRGEQIESCIATCSESEASFFILRRELQDSCFELLSVFN